MPNAVILSSALALLLQHDECGSAVCAGQAAHVLAHLADSPELDAETRALCERASLRLTDISEGRSHA
jgi:hypothetical protein